MKIKDLPEEIRDEALRAQVAQGNPANGYIEFGQSCDAGGFNFMNTAQGSDWNMVYHPAKHEMFIEKYKLRKIVPKFGDRVLVSTEGDSWTERIYLGTSQDPEVLHLCVASGYEKEFTSHVEITTMWWKYMKPIEGPVYTELSLEDIAKKFDIPVDKLRIKK